MRLIAKKPCSFGGRQFYIGDEIPVDFVTDAKLQEKMGMIAIVDDGMGVSGGQPGTLYTQEQVEELIAEAVEEAVGNTIRDMRKEQEAFPAYAAELKETEPRAFDGVVQIAVRGASDGQFTAVFAKPEEIQQVFSIMQQGVEDGARAVADVVSENVLILLHAADSRKMVKNAAKERADRLFPAESEESGKGNEATGPNEEGDDA